MSEGKQASMSARERVLTLLRGGKPDRVPWMGDLDYWATALVGRGQRPKGFQQSPEYIDWHMDLRVGFYLQGYFPFRTIIENCEVREWNEGDDRLRQVTTPKGVLCERWRWLPEHFSEAPVEHLVKSVADLPAYQFMQANSRYEPDYALAEQRAEILRRTGAGVMLTYLPRSPLMQMVAVDAGIMAVVEMLTDDEALFSETFAAAKESHDRAARIAVDSPAEILMIPENLSSEVVGPKLFERFLRPYQTEWAVSIKEAGKISCIHLDGTLKGLLREECTVGLDFIEAMTPTPSGDLAVEDWAGYVGETDTIFWGGIPGIMFTPLVSDEEFDEHLIRALRVMRRSPRYVLGVADQVPPSGLESRVRRVAELVEEFGEYD